MAKHQMTNRSEGRYCSSRARMRRNLGRYGYWAIASSGGTMHLPGERREHSSVTTRPDRGVCGVCGNLWTSVCVSEPVAGSAFAGSYKDLTNILSTTF